MLNCASICGEILVSGVFVFFGSEGIGLFGSLDAQLGMLLCLCCDMLVENELRLA